MSSITLITPELRRIEDASADVVVLFRFGEMKPLAGVTSLIDWRLLGHLSKVIIEGFFLGEGGETLLMPLGPRLPQKHLLLFGIGERSGFDQETYQRAVSRMFDTTRDLGCRDIVMALPGRVENACDTVEATEWFLSCYESDGAHLQAFQA